MKSFNFTLLSCFFVLLLSLQMNLVRGQDTTLKHMEQLEAAILAKKTLVETRQALTNIKQQALKSGNDILYARSLYNLMQVRDRLTEDTLYFRNSAFIDTLLRTASSPKMKAMLHLMRAQRISRFGSRFNRFNAAAYRTKDLKPDYAALSTASLDSIAALDMEAALQYNGTNADSKQLLWLSSNPDVFLFDYGYKDIVLAERVNIAALKRYYNDGQKASFTSWLALPSAAFVKKLDSLAATRNVGSNMMVAYQQWLNFHKASPSIASFIESLTRKYIYLAAPSDSATRQVYIRYLQSGIASPYPVVKAHAVYQLCLIWNEEGNKYFVTNRYNYQPLPNFDPQYQYLPAKALQLYQQHKALLARYPVFDKVLAAMAAQISTASIQVDTDDQHLPGEAIPLKALYKNTSRLFYRVIRVGAAAPTAKKSVTATAELLNHQPAAEGVFNLPLPPDNNRHAVYLKLEQLPVGHYRLLFGSVPIKADSSVHNINFEVTGIAAVNTDENIFVLNRKTGFPLAGARIKAFKKEAAVNSGVAAVAAANGLVKVKNTAADSLAITYRGDTTGYRFSISKNEWQDNDDVYDKEEYDDLAEFYDDKLRMEIFTDRSIYRPGQTVHYKIILLTKNAKTGDIILLNRQNIGAKNLKQWLSDTSDKIWLKDPFNKKIDSAVLKINDFGSFAGSFTIPKTAATGQWYIDGAPRAGYNNNGYFKVEEYKRPTIELSIEKQTKRLLPGQPFSIKLKLRSLSGADLGNVPVKYTIGRSGKLPSKKAVQNVYNNDYTVIQLLSSTGYTNEKGELSIAVNDSVLAKADLADSVAWSYSYRLNATAVDVTGESAEIDESLSVSSRPVRISIPLNNTYDKQTFPVLAVNTSADFEGTVGRKVNIKLFKVSNPDNNGSRIKQADQWYYKEADWNNWFPDKAVAQPAVHTKLLVLDTVINTAAFEKLKLPEPLLQSGFYQLVATTQDNNRIVGQSDFRFKVFDSKSGDSPVDDIDYMPVNSGKPGDIISWYSSGKNDRYTIYQVLYVSGLKKRVIKNIYETVTEKAGVSLWKFQVPPDATGQLQINQISVGNNDINNHQKTFYLNATGVPPIDIIVEKYRKVMAPGAKETVTLSVKTKNDKVAAEILTTLYDASLDKLEEHHWNLPDAAPRPYYFSSRWNYTLTTAQQAGNYTESAKRINLQEIQYFGTPGAGTSYALQGRLPGLSVTNASGLQEVVMVSYNGPVYEKAFSTASLVTLRGMSSLREYNQPLIIVDGEVFTGDLKNMNPGSISQAIVLKGADASALYGARAAQGVLILSTKGPIVLPGSEEPVVKVRKNFNETAFFFPQVHAGADGYYTFSFTMPETATEWNWKMVAHTRDARFAYLEKKLQTQLSLMVQPNMPRLLYQGDKIVLQSRVSNLDTLAVTGKATCKIEDAVTGQDLTAVLTGNSIQAFSLSKKSSGAVSFMLQIPATQLNPLKMVITATSAGAADAEEHIIPVLSSKVFVRQSQPVNFANQPAITVTPVKLPNDANLYGMGLSVAQKPQASLIYALPWLANYPYDCAEQMFNKLRANVTAIRLMQTDTAAQSAYKAAALAMQQNKPKEGQLPDELADETMPWLGLTNNTSQQQKQLLRLLDTTAAKQDISKYLDKLYKLQQPDGGISWFDGGKSNAYISAYVLAGFGQLQQTGWRPNGTQVKPQYELIKQLLQYNQGLVRNPTIIEKPDNLFRLYALSYWKNDASMPAQDIGDIQTALSSEWKNAGNTSLQQQALLIISTLRYMAAGSTLYSRALQQLENIRQQAILDEANGLRWKEMADSEELNTSAEETMALLAEAFGLSGKYKDVHAGIVKWLLTAKQDAHWQTTKATAAAVDILQKEKGSVFGEPGAITAQADNHTLKVSDGLLNGVPAAAMPLKQLPGAVTLQQQGTGVKGAVTWYYFATPDKLDTLSKGIKVNKTFYMADSGKGRLPLAPGTVLKAGDKIQVELVIETASRLKFVHIHDPRAAAFEPKAGSSGYRYNQGFGYYQSVRDAGLNLFAELVPRGISTITYELVVAHEGEFASGPVRLQCMYQPAKTAYSSTARITTGK